jgi:hypothetical protein
MYNHIGVTLEDLSTKNIGGKRFYVSPDNNYYPSITTVLSDRNKKGLMEWRKRVGDDVANHIARTSAARGTAVHSMCEDHLNNIEVTSEGRDFLPFCLFNKLKSEGLSKIDNIHAQECGLYSDKYRIAGRVDCIAEYDGVLSIIDFKTSRSERKDAWNENYYIQATAYAEMYEERTGIAIDQIVILVVTENGDVQEFVRQKTEYLPLLVDAIDEFTIKWEKENEGTTDSVSA